MKKSYIDPGPQGSEEHTLGANESDEMQLTLEAQI
jgi:hypothetical protein